MDPGDVRVRRIVRRSRNMRVATLSAGGVPHVTPLRYVPDGTAIYALTRGVTLVARHVARHPDVVLLFDGDARGGPGPGPVLRVRARASVRSDPDLARRCLRRAVLRYFLRPAGVWNMVAHWRRLPAWLGEVRRSAPETAALVVFEPLSAELLPVP
jgi:Pyridoxamine 5'-phosphate oxidase